MKRPILDVRYKTILGVLILGMALSVIATAQTSYKSPERASKAFQVMVSRGLA